VSDRGPAGVDAGGSVAQERPSLSVVVAPTRGGVILAGCLEALAGQRDAPPTEVIVPVDASVAGVESLRRAHPEVRFLEVADSAELAASPRPGIAHLAIDRRRAAGLAAARGDVVALTEEHARPDPDWCRRLLLAHREPHAAIGGAIENSGDRTLNWALYFLDAGRYQNPLPEGPARYVSDVNVSYKRSALEAVAPAWREIYHETGLHDALRTRGGTLWLRPDLVVYQDRGAARLGPALRERFAWARLYAGRRAREVPGPTRAMLVLGAPLLGGLLLLRQARLALVRGRHRGAFLRALPLLALFDAVWGLGELVGYATGWPTPRDRAC